MAQGVNDWGVRHRPQKYRKHGVVPVSARATCYPDSDPGTRKWARNLKAFAFVTLPQDAESPTPPRLTRNLTADSITLGHHPPNEGTDTRNQQCIRQCSVYSGNRGLLLFQLPLGSETGKAALFRLIQPINYAEERFVSLYSTETPVSGQRSAATRSWQRHFTSVTGTSVVVDHLVATDPSTMPETALRPRDPITMIAALFLRIGGDGLADRAGADVLHMFARPGRVARGQTAMT